MRWLSITGKRYAVVCPRNERRRHAGKGKEMKTVTVPVKGLNFAGCGCEIEKRLGKLAPILAVEGSYVTQTTPITYDETRMKEAQLRKLVEDCGFAWWGARSLE